MRPVTPIHGDLHLVLLASWDSSRVPRCRAVSDPAGSPSWLGADHLGPGLAAHARGAGAGSALRCRGAYRF